MKKSTLGCLSDTYYVIRLIWVNVRIVFRYSMPFALQKFQRLVSSEPFMIYRCWSVYEVGYSTCQSSQKLTHFILLLSIKKYAIGILYRWFTPGPGVSLILSSKIVSVPSRWAMIPDTCVYSTRICRKQDNVKRVIEFLERVGTVHIVGGGEVMITKC
jgi:hypothetical protein